MIGGGPGGQAEATVMLLKADRRRLEVRMVGGNAGKTLLEFKLDKKATQK